MVADETILLACSWFQKKLRGDKNLYLNISLETIIRNATRKMEPVKKQTW